MKFGASHQVSAVDRPLVLRARADVQLAPVQFSGQTAYVLKDPLTLELFHLSAEEYFLFEKLGQTMSLKGLQAAFQERFAPRRISPQQLQQGMNQLHNQGLLLSEAAGQGAELLRRDERRRRSERWQSWLKMLSFRLGSVDATGIVDGLHCKLRWLFSVPMLLVAVSLFVYAISILLGQGREVFARLPSLAELAQPRYWLLWLATVAFVKVIHELAHAITCKHFGGRCHEIGMLLLAMMPCLYCDVSDVWRLSNKWQRIAVSAAGMITELVIASVALVGWWHTQPGLLNVWLLSVVVVCSVGTLLVNANPLLRYDGYYILSDWVEVPNLAGRAQGLLPAALRRWLLAEPRVDDPLLAAHQRHGLLVYAVAARVYLTLVLLGIFVMLLAWTRPYRLENLVYTLAGITLAGMLLMPFIGVWRTFRNPSTRYRMRRRRLAGLMFVVAGFAAVFFLWPISRSVNGPAVLVPVEARPVYATAAGELQFALPSGTAVRAGDVLARLVDADSELAMSRQQGEFEVRQVRYEQLGTLRTWNEKSAEQLPTARAARDDAAAQLDQLRSKTSELTIRSPATGVIIAPPSFQQADHEEGRLPLVSGTPLESRNLGCWIEPGTVLCQVGDPELLEVLVMIDQVDVAEVQPGNAVRILLESSPVQILEGEVIQVGRRSEDRLAVDPNVDVGKYHLVQVRLRAQDAALLVGFRGTAKIEANRNTLSSIVANELRQMFRLPW